MSTDGASGSDLDRPMPSVAHYRLLKELGRGGQGAVYLAEDTILSRKVALKILARSILDAPGQQMRFQREASVTARLDHPGICTVYEAGVADEVSYIAMRYLEGETLAQRIAAVRAGPEPVLGDSVWFDSVTGSSQSGAAGQDGKQGRPAVRKRDPSVAEPSTREGVHQILEMIEKVARALHVAHEAGVVHRDVKPSNIMLCGHEPVVLDFGLARDVSGDLASIAESGSLLGTPAYMSPEQIAAQRIAIDRRTDVYSLGVTLYECLTLARPFDAPTREGLYLAIMTADPPDPRKLNKAIPEDLKVALECALEKNREKRYQTAAAFAEDLRRIRADEPILARRASLLSRGIKFVRRHRAASAAVGALVLALSVAGIVWWLQPGRLTIALPGLDGRVQIDDDPPFEIAAGGTQTVKLSPGTHTVQLLRTIPKVGRTYGTRDVVHVPRGGEVRIERFLAPPEATIQLESDPPGASVTLLTEWGEEIPVPQPTPTMFTVVAGNHRARFELAGFDRREQDLVIAPGESVRRSKQAWPNGRLALRSDQEGTRVQIYAGDKVAATRPIRTVTLPNADPIRLPAGSWSLRAERPDHDSRLYEGKEACKVEDGKLTATSIWLQPWIRSFVHPMRFGAVRTIVADLDGSGMSQIVSGGGERVEVLSRKGSIEVEIALSRRLTDLEVLDVDGDGVHEIFVRTDEDCIVFDNKGRDRWKVPFRFDVKSHVAFADLDGDRSLELVTVTEGGLVAIWEHDGRPRAQVEIGAPVTHFRTMDLDGDGRREIVVTAHPAQSLFFDPSRLLGLSGKAQILFDVQLKAQAIGLVEFGAEPRKDRAIGVTLGTGQFSIHGNDGANKAMVPLGRGLTAAGEGVEIVRSDTEDGKPTFLIAGAGRQVFRLSEAHQLREVVQFKGAVTQLRNVDLDGDGALEAVAVSDRGDVAILGRNGAPRFRIALDTTITDVLATDLDGDGILDLVASGPRQAVGIGADGAIRFQIDVPEGLSSLRAADLDGDGIPELIETTNRSEIVLIERDRRRRLQYRARGSIEQLKFADLDDDGKPEIVAGGSLEIKAWTKGGQETVQIPTTASLIGMEVEDLDGDGHPEILAEASDGRLDCFSRTGNSRFRRRTSTAFRPVPVDLNGDGISEVVAGGALTQEIEAYDLGGIVKAHAGGFGNVTKVVPADFDRDGKPELVVASRVFGGGITVLRSDFTTKARNVIGWVKSVAVADVDGDGKDEIILRLEPRRMLPGGRRPGRAASAPASAPALAPSPGRLVLLDQECRPKWEVPMPGNQNEADHLLVTDLDGDGTKEMIVVAYEPGSPKRRVVAISSDGTERFSIESADAVQILKALDLDGDGKPEILVGTSGGQVRCVDAKGKTRFRTELGRWSVTRLDSADFDGDGKPEIVAWSPTFGRASTCAVLGADGAPRVLLEDEDVSAVGVLDVDGDGRPDLVTADHFGFVTVWDTAPDARARAKREFLLGLEAAARQDEPGAAAAFGRSGLRWLAFAGSSADLYRLRLFKLRSSPSAKRMAQAFDRLRPRWLERLRREAFAEGSDVVPQIVGTALELGGPGLREDKPASERLDEALRRIGEADAASTRPESRPN